MSINWKKNKTPVETPEPKFSIKQTYQPYGPTEN